MNNTMEQEHCIDVCNRLLRGEISAVETYSQAIDKHAGKPDIEKLVDLRTAHQNAVATLQENIRSMGGSPEHDSGAWGDFTGGVQKAANLFGEKSAIESLKQGEAHGKRDYESALEDEGVLPECKELIRSELLPQCEQNIGALDTLQETSA